MSQVKVIRLRKPHGRTVASDILYTCATCGHCRRGSACRYDCLCFLVYTRGALFLMYVQAEGCENRTSPDVTHSDQTWALFIYVAL